ncbi:hypothetical protein [Microbacterium karelineae]|uniref:hypothetical protein n=1 Tax=Microbacterium karelineae TaxID=2654283 RepID=UPI0012E9DFAE|nr:hypothetical protein [Microbacterium karelineae]
MFDRDAAETILEAVLLGMEPHRAALAAGITAEEHAAWIEQGRSAHVGSTALDTQEGALVAQYVRDLDRAMALSELDALKQVKDGSDAHRWFLERRFPNRWAKTPAALWSRPPEQPAASVPTNPDQQPDDDADGRMDDLRRKREEKRRAAGGDPG